MGETPANEDLNPADDDVVEGHGIEEDDLDDEAGLDALTLCGTCIGVN